MPFTPKQFADRIEAGRFLAEKLVRFAPDSPGILAGRISAMEEEET